MTKMYRHRIRVPDLFRDRNMSSGKRILSDQRALLVHIPAVCYCYGQVKGVTMQAFIEWFMAVIGGSISPQMSVFIVSMIPLVEERGGLILSRLLNLPMWEGVLWCVLGNILPIPLILFFIERLLHWMSEHHMSRIASWIEQKAVKNKPKIDRYGFWGLMLFVGIPLPGTGAWTGSLVAALFDMDLKQASVSILLGIALAAVIMTTLSYGIFG